MMVSNETVSVIGFKIIMIIQLAIKFGFQHIFLEYIWFKTCSYEFRCVIDINVV